MSTQMELDRNANRKRKWKTMNDEQIDVIRTWNSHPGGLSQHISLLRCCQAARSHLAKVYFEDMRNEDADTVGSLA